MLVSILIPVYKNSQFLPGLLKRLCKDPYKSKEILVAIDEPEPAARALARKFRSVKFYFNSKRIGKAAALNALAKRAKGNILLFLDSDVVIKQRKFISKIVEGMADTDILDIKKKILRTNIFTKLTHYDYLLGHIVFSMSSKERKSIFLCGAAFAIKKEAFDAVGGFKRVTSEDFGLSLDCFLQNRKYKMADNIEVYTAGKENMRSWLEQRKRWAIGASEQIITHWKDYLKCIKVAPKLMAKIVLWFLWPAFVIGLGAFLMGGFFEKLAAMLLFMLSIKFATLIPFVLLTGFTFILIKNTLLFLLVYLISAALHFGFARKFNFKFSHKEYLIYYFIYAPFEIIVYAYYGTKPIFGKSVAIDWKV